MPRPIPSDPPFCGGALGFENDSICGEMWLRITEDVFLQTIIQPISERDLTEFNNEIVVNH